jgi:hypothetical protein
VPSWLRRKAQLELAPNVAAASLDELRHGFEASARSPPIEAPASTAAEPLSSHVVGRLDDLRFAAVRADDRHASSAEAPAVRVPARPRAVSAAVMRRFVRVGDESLRAARARALALVGNGMQSPCAGVRAVVPNAATELTGRRREDRLAPFSSARPLTSGAVTCRGLPTLLDRAGELMPVQVTLRLVLHKIQPAVGLSSERSRFTTAAVTEAVGNRAVRVGASRDPASAARYVHDRRGCYGEPARAADQERPSSRSGH